MSTECFINTPTCFPPNRKHLVVYFGLLRAGKYRIKMKNYSQTQLYKVCGIKIHLINYFERNSWLGGI